jgi:hypothetical protein
MGRLRPGEEAVFSSPPVYGESNTAEPACALQSP